MKTLICTLSVCFCALSIISAQSAAYKQSNPRDFPEEEVVHACGFNPSHLEIKEMDRIHQEYKDFSDYMRSDRTAKHLPVKFHVFTKDDGSGGLTPEQIELAMSDMNATYEGTDMSFYQCGSIEYIADEDLFDFERTTNENHVLNTYEDDDVINIYAFNSVRIGGSGVCGYAKFPPSKPMVFITFNCTQNKSTLSHEIGHAFGLYHTHGPSNGGFSDELVDGSNCETGGDRICDTPADPNLAFGGRYHMDVNCVYTGTFTDANGDYFDPDTRNIMAYSRKHCRQHFSDGQADYMHYMANTYRSNLSCNGACQNSYTYSTTNV